MITNVNCRLTIICLLCIFLMTFAFVPTANCQRQPEPEYIDTYFMLESKAGKLLTLEKQVIQVFSKSKGKLFSSKGQYGYQIPGDRSPVRFEEGKPIEIVVRAATRDVDPLTFIVFWALKPGEGVRVIETNTIKGGFGGVKQSGTGVENVAFEAVKYGQSSFLFRPVSKLLPGEYVVFTSKKSDQVFCFGIDPAPVAPK